MQVKVDKRDTLPVEGKFRKEKPFLSHAPRPEGDRLRLPDPVPGQNGVAVAQVQQTHPPVIDPEHPVLEARVHSQILEVVEIAGPSGTLVDFLEGDHVGFEILKEPGDPSQVDLKLPAGRQPLDGSQAAAVGDIEGH